MKHDQPEQVLKIKQTVRHPNFGLGIIVDIETMAGQAGGYFYVVQFWRTQEEKRIPFAGADSLTLCDADGTTIEAGNVPKKRITLPSLSHTAQPDDDHEDS